MADDIVTRLHSFADMLNGGYAKKLAVAAAGEIERLRADRDRWRSIADGFAEAGTHPTAHQIALEMYEEACRG